MKHALILIAVMGLVACDIQINFGDELVQVEKRLTRAHRDGSGLRVRTKNGRIKVRRGGHEVVVVATVKAKTEERAAGVEIRVDYDADGILDIQALWPETAREGSEGVSFEITTPATTRVDLETHNGRIDIDDLSGPAVLLTRNGRIEIDGHEGDVDAQTKNGRIDADGVRGPLKLTTSNGRIKVDVPSRGAGDFHLDTGNGRIDVELPANWKGEVEVSSKNGRIDLPGNAQVLQREKRRARFRMSQGGGQSSAHSANGRIKIR